MREVIYFSLVVTGLEMNCTTVLPVLSRMHPRTGTSVPFASRACPALLDVKFKRRNRVRFGCDTRCR